MTVATTNVRDDLLARIREKRQQVEVFVGGALPRKRRLLNITIFGGALAAAFTAGPVAGGASFTAWLTSTFGFSTRADQSRTYVVVHVRSVRL